jgi:cytidyltransferase-like protein
MTLEREGTGDHAGSWPASAAYWDDQYCIWDTFRTKFPLMTLIDAKRSRGMKVVFTNGCFDILHVGHIRYLRKAKSLGDILVVGLNTDRSVRLIKGEKRPIVPQDDRAEVLASLKNHRLAQAIADVGLYEFRRQMSYQGGWHGCEILIADRFYPSSKRCSGCGQVKPDLMLNEREYRCEYCGLVIDRDLNAAINLEQLLYV